MVYVRWHFRSLKGKLRGAGGELYVRVYVFKQQALVGSSVGINMVAFK